jgi:hypothetical protein
VRSPCPPLLIITPPNPHNAYRIRAVAIHFTPGVCWHTRAEALRTLERETEAAEAERRADKLDAIQQA